MISSKFEEKSKAGHHVTENVVRHWHWGGKNENQNTPRANDVMKRMQRLGWWSRHIWKTPSFDAIWCPIDGEDWRQSSHQQIIFSGWGKMQSNRWLVDGSAQGLRECHQVIVWGERSELHGRQTDRGTAGMLRDSSSLWSVGGQQLMGGHVGWTPGDCSWQGKEDFVGGSNRKMHVQMATWAQEKGQNSRQWKQRNDNEDLEGFQKRGTRKQGPADCHVGWMTGTHVT